MPTVQVQPDDEELLQEVANSILKSKKVIVVTGAGISTNSGIPDFRSENGLYSLIQAQFDAANRIDTAETSDAEDEAHGAKRRRLCDDDQAGIQGSQGSARPREETEATTADSAKDLADRADAQARDEELFPEIGGRSTRQRLIADEQQPTTPLDAPQSRRSKGKHPLRKSLHTSQVDASLNTYQQRTQARVSGRPSSVFSSPLPRKNDPRSAAHFCDESIRTPRRTERAMSLPPNDHTPSQSTRCPSPQRPSHHRYARRNSEGSISTPSAHRARSTSPIRTGQTLPKRAPALCHLPAQSSLPFATPNRILSFPLSSSPLSSPPSSSVQAPPLPPHFKCADVHMSSRLTRPPLAPSSSPLSSPPPVLFDPFQHPSSSTSQQNSSDADSTTSSDPDDTPSSSVPSLVSQTSNPSRSSLPNLKGRDLFDVSIWSDPIRTSVFYTFITSLRRKVQDIEPTPSHRFISHLRNRGKLVRCYTQNIDQIEEKVGLSTSLQQGPGSRGRFSRKSTSGITANAGGYTKEGSTATGSNGGVECVFLHGSLRSLRCFLCARICEWDEDDRSLETMSGRQPECPHCVGATTARQEKGKRALGVGKLRPDIVLYGEEHPSSHLIDPIVKHDLALYPDFLLILGTSLKVHGLKVLVREFAKTVHCKGGKVAFVNFTKPSESSWGDIIDYWIQWDCDAWVSNLQERIPLLWLPPGTKLPAPSKRKRETPPEGKVTKTRESSGAKPSESSEASRPSKTSKTQNPPVTITPCETGTAKPDSEKAPMPVLASAIRTEPGRSSTSIVTNRETESESSKPSKISKAPARPMSMREDKVNAAYLCWEITRELRRISGNATELEIFSTPSRASLPGAPTSAPPAASNPFQAPLPPEPKINDEVNPSRPRMSLPSDPVSLLERQGPLKPPIPSRDKINQPKKRTSKPAKRTPGWTLVPHDAPEALAVAARQEDRNSSANGTGDHEDQSLLAAIKSNPRRRKRKMIDGVEVGLPSTTPRRMSSETIANPVSRDKIFPAPIPAPRFTAKENCQIKPRKNPLHVNHTTSTSLTRPPTHQPPKKPAPGSIHTMLPKLPPLEPRNPPTGPLASIAPNIAAARVHTHHVPHPMSSRAFAYFDALVHQLSHPQPLAWTPEDQLKKETDAAAGLDRLREARK